MLKKHIPSKDKLMNYKIPVGIVLVGLITLMVLIFAKPRPEPKQAVDEVAHVKVEVTKAQPQTLRLAVTAHGTVIPRREIDLIAQVSGQIVSVEPAFVDGGFFNASQVLIQIDDRDYQVALLNAKARLAEAARLLATEEGMSRVAKREWRELGNKKANDLFARKPQLAAAQANLASAQGDVDRAELNLERTKITVPFNGRVKQTYADLGQFVTTGSRIATVYDSTVVEVRIPLTEQQASLIDLPLTPEKPEENLTEGIAPVSKLAPVTVKGSVAGESYQWQGVLARTDAFIDANSRMYYVVVEVHNPFSTKTSDNKAQAPLLPGLFVEAEIDGKQVDNVMVLPRSALFKRDKIITLADDNSVEYQTVKVLRKSDSQVWVQTSLMKTALIALEKQSVTPEGAVIEPLLAVDSADRPTAIAVAESVEK